MTTTTQSDAQAFVVYSGFIKKGARMQSTAIVSFPPRRRLCVVSDRRGRMSSRRGVRPELFQGSGSPAYKAITQQLDDYAERTEVLFERMEKRLDRMDNDVQRTQMGQERLTTELAEMRRDVGELRDATHMAANKAVTTAETVAVDLKGAIKRPIWMRWQAIGVALVAFIAVYKNVGTLAKDMTSFWRYIIGEAPPAHSRPLVEEKK